MARRDLGSLAIHWTKAAGGGGGFFRKAPPRLKADAVLGQILTDGALRGGDGHIKGRHICVCFTEAPLVEMVSVFASIALAGNADALQYEPYGIGVSKEWLFQLGGRPVIYQPAHEYEQLPEGVRWRHVSFDPPGIDFTWEREWRIPAKNVNLDAAQTWVFVPSQIIADHFVEKYPGWRIVPLELFGLPSASGVISRREA